MGDRSILLENFHTFGDLLKYLRRRAQLTQRQLSIAVGYSESQISRLEANLRMPDQASLMALFVPALLIQEEPQTIHRLLELAQLARAGEPSLPLAAEEPVHRHNLRAQLTSFIGREKEIGDLRQQITAGPTRLVTLTGSGGVGKTRLALRTAQELLDDFTDGVWLVQLASLANPDLVAQTAITALGLHQMSGQTATQVLCEHLRTKRLLLIFDNCEHLVCAVSELVETLLRACPHLRILATSRELLGVDGEMPFRCPSLYVPDPQHLPPITELAQCEALRLFTERAQTSSPGFSLNEVNAALTARVCQRLDGIPLAIELAAARVRLLSLEQIASRLEADFHLLTGGSRTALPRHQTLKALIDWSYNLLSEKERRLLRRLSVFAGGWTLEAAEKVCADAAIGQLSGDEIVDLLGQLVDKSLVVVVADTSNDASMEHLRYRMLETIRQYAGEKLACEKPVDNQLIKDGDERAVRQRHLDYFLALALQAEPHLRGKGQRVWNDRLDVDMDNIRLALEWALSNDIEKGLQIAMALEWFCHFHEYWREDIGWLERLLAEESAIAADVARGVGAAMPGNPLRSTSQSLARGKAINALVTIKLNWADLENIDSLLEEVRPIFEEQGNLAPRELARYLQNLALMEQDLNRSITGTMRALDLLRKSGDTFLIEDALFNLAYLNIVKGDFTQARTNAEECLTRAKESEDVGGEGAYLRLLGNLDLISGNLHQAIVKSGKAQSCFDFSGNRSLSVAQRDIQAHISMSEGNYSQAIQLSEAVLAWSINMNEKLMMLEAINFLGWEAWALKDYDQATRQCEKSLALAIEFRPTFGITMELIAISAQYILGRVAISRREYAHAYIYLKEKLLSLEGKSETFGILSLYGGWLFGLRGIAYKAINALGVLASAQHQARRAAVLFGAQAEMYEWQKNILSLAEREEYEQALASTRTALGERAFMSAWEEGQAMTLDQAIAYALAPAS
jgi:predicted ATPase/transcriptional regulator with XRE-family HTH domain/tetratricopeptide (TPR) repeat protein